MSKLISIAFIILILNLCVSGNEDYCCRPNYKQGRPGKRGIQGPEGPTGSAGKNGSPGSVGSAGPPGSSGSTGPKGDRGSSGSPGKSVDVNQIIKMVDAKLASLRIENSALELRIEKLEKCRCVKTPIIKPLPSKVPFPITRGPIFTRFPLPDFPGPIPHFPDGGRIPFQKK
ncbi:uncharacterized protein LOC120342945 [Styela clava]